MSIPTVAVTCTATDQNGFPVAGALYTAKLNTTEIHQGFVVPEIIRGLADANGVCVLQLWPNALGVAGSLYDITAVNPDTGKKFLKATVSVPNSACNLHQILVQAPYPPVDASQQALIAAQGALAPVTAQVALAGVNREAAETAAAQALTRSAAAALSQYNAGLFAAQALDARQDVIDLAAGIDLSGSGTGSVTEVSGMGVINVATGTTTPVISIVQNATNRFVSDTEKSTWNAKQAALGFTPEQAGVAATLDAAHTAASDPHPQYTTAAELSSAIAGKANSATTLGGYGITDAAPSSHVGGGGAAHANAVAAGAAGFMTGADKSKLDGVAAGAQVNPSNTDAVTEGATNLYFSAARVRSAVLTGLSTAAATVVDATHSVLQAIGFLQKQVSDNATAISGKQATLVSGTNLRTVNGASLLGSTDLTIGASPGGSTTQVQFNDGGVFAGDAGLTFDKTTKILTAGPVVASAPVGNTVMATFKYNNATTYVMDVSYGLQVPSNGSGSLSAGSAGILGWSSTGVVLNTLLFSLSNQDLRLTYDAAGTLAQRNGTAAQISRIYNTYTDASNYERLKLGFSGNTAHVDTEAGGTGTKRNLALMATGGRTLVGTTTDDGVNTLQVAGNAKIGTQSTPGTLEITSNSYAIIKNTNKGTGQDLRLEGGPNVILDAPGMQLAVSMKGCLVPTSQATSCFGWSGDPRLSNPDLALYRDAAGTLAQRNGANAQEFRLYKTYTDASNYERAFMRAGAGGLEIGSEFAGTGGTMNATVYGPNGRYISINSAGIRLNTTLYPDVPTRDLGISGGNEFQNLYLSGYVKTGAVAVSALPAAAAAGTGARAFVTNATATHAAGIGTVVAGGGTNKVPVYSDGTSWLIG